MKQTLSSKIDHRVKQVLITNAQIKTAVKSLAVKLNKEYQGKQPILIGVLKGCLPFYNELFLQLTCDPIADFMIVSSYRGTHSQGTAKIVTDTRQNIKGRNVIIIEDIVDTGHTLKALKQILMLRKPKSLRIVTLLNKPACRVVKLEPDYVCFTIKPVFVVGFGLDYNECMRNLPYIGELKESVYSREEK
ncbi:MAG: hypoxanthine phosphoribosyltransferase [Mycoplasmataceae bacterium]|jgi:hypoxanthine phosphoribosyltransferase|nr:hypoxanthine phosphoribosyltransferase [Mycoplasmataceae bacterium]